MQETPVLYSVTNGIAEICFNRPKARNALNVATADGLLEALTDIDKRTDVRVIVLKGAGGAFVAGGDLAFMRDAGDKVPEAADRLVGTMHKAMLMISSSPLPVIASLNGPVAGAGMSLAMSADMVIAAENAVFNMAYINIANNTDCGASWFLPRLVGLHKAMEIVMLSKNIDASEALSLGLVNKVVPLDDLATETASLASALTDKAPLALASMKRLVLASSENNLSDQLDAEAESFVNLTRSDDFKEALDAFFGKRKPSFKGS